MDDLGTHRVDCLAQLLDLIQERLEVRVAMGFFHFVTKSPLMICLRQTLHVLE